MPTVTGAACDVLTSPDLLEHILPLLSARDAARAAGTCSVLAKAVRALLARVLILDSQAAGFFEVNFASGHVHEVGRAHKGRYSVKHWPTGAAMSPYDGDVYVSEYQNCGILRFLAGSLKYRRIEYTSKSCCKAPEGLVFAHDTMYCANVADEGSVLRIRRSGTTQQVFSLVTLVPWMLAIGPDGALYVSVDQQYEAASSYGNPQEYDVTGAVFRIELLADGTMAYAAPFVPAGSGGLKRPCGLCFDAAGFLYVTSLSNQVLKFAGPLHADAGRLHSVFIDTARAGLSHPYDVRWCSRGLLVTTHAAQMDRRNGDTRAAISLFNSNGSLKRSVTCEQLRHPNTIVSC